MTADANKAESMLCMDKARQALKEGDSGKAERMLNKAVKLDPTQDISFLMKKVKSMGSPQSSSDSANADRSYAHDDHYDETHLRSRRPQRQQREEAKASSPKQSPSRQSNGNDHRSKSGDRHQLGVHYTQDEVKLVERIRHCKDYYEILNVKKDTPDAVIKKEYRKMALQLHPDKCRAPHATEAFKALGNAYAVISDKDKRAAYDVHGADGPPERRGRGDYFEYDYGRGFEADITPEEIFNMFFGGGYADMGQFRRRNFNPHTEQHHHRQPDCKYQSAFTPLLQLAPLLFILLLGLLTQFMVGDPPFSLNQSNKYTIRRETRELHVTYFVKKDFETAYRGRIEQVEQQVEDEYINQLRMHCYKEQSQKESMKYRARIYHDADLLKRAENMPMPHCTRLQQIYSH
ncbi:hypothetical protein PENTCL1PPCAC_18279 [Pristionchus entomophagus]|uniref:J domain-containing protein n=1 Tax=Pristionchus entomophagus TaxID=358040 RepID=A0AAV5TNZ8_9BILA|nr:hypothetical protein PENTCL1PPCAC_18279 [Pristionchus entomophagus]